MSHQFEVFNPYHSQGLAAGGSALLDAINKGKIHLAKFILDAGEYDIVNTRDFKGKTPLIRACYIKEEKTRDRAVQLLLRKGANVNLRDEVGRTALSYACEMRCNDIVRILVKNNVNPDLADILGSTPLIYSARVGNDTAIEILIRSFRRLGLNVDHVNNEGMTALLTAAKNGFIGCATLLAIDGRASLTLRDPETGMNAEELARTRGCSNSEVLPFSPSANPGQLRLSRCGSLLTAKTSPETMGVGGSGGGVARGDESDGGGGGRRASMRVPLTTSPVQRSRLVEETSASGSGQCPLLPFGGDVRRGSRRRRHSLPDIRFGRGGSPSSFDDDPDDQSLLQLLDPDMPPNPQQERKLSSSGRRSRAKGVTPGGGGATGATVTPAGSRAALGPRRSRELVRADTDVTRSDAYYDDDDDDCHA